MRPQRSIQGHSRSLRAESRAQSNRLQGKHGRLQDRQARVRSIDRSMFVFPGFSLLISRGGLGKLLFSMSAPEISGLILLEHRTDSSARVFSSSLKFLLE